MGVLEEAIDNRKNDRRLVNLGKPFDEVHRNIRPDLRLYVERLQEHRWLEGRRLIALTCSACPDVRLNQRLVTKDVKIRSEVLKRILYALVATWTSWTRR